MEDDRIPITEMALESEIADVARLVLEGRRLDREQAIRILETADIALLGRLADLVRARVAGDIVSIGHNLNLNPTNICELRCPICAYSRDAGDPDAYVLDLAEAERRVSSHLASGLREVHVVGGISRDCDLAYYEALFRRIKGIDPRIHIQGLTAVEVDAFARWSGLPARDVLVRLRDAGLGSIPGGGAEVFAPHVRAAVAPKKISGERWLEIMRIAHGLGIRSNATLLYGHVERAEDVADHLLALRALQDETGGFLAFVPLAFHPENTALDGVAPGPTGLEDLRILAAGRLILDNFPHVKALWMYLGPKMAQVALSYGADDLGATSIDERIVRAAGGRSSPSWGLADLVRLAREAGRHPVIVNALYEDSRDPPSSSAAPPRSLLRASAAIEKGRAGERLDAADGEALFDADLHELGSAADRVRARIHTEGMVSFIVDRNITFSNICSAACDFCAFWRAPGDPEAFRLTRDEVVDRVRELLARGGTQVMLQAGLDPAWRLADYEALLRAIKAACRVTLHSLSPAEVWSLSRREGLPVRAVLERLRAAGLDSLPGAAEILVDRVRRIVSPRKLSAAEWFEVMEAAHAIGMRTTATMTFGLGETKGERVEHLLRIRSLQDRTGGFRAFIPWSFSPHRTRLSHYPVPGGEDYLRTVAVSRLVLDNVKHIHAGWVTEGWRLAQVALRFGANDLGGILMEEVVVKATGIENEADVAQMVDVIRRAGFTPAQRDTEYRILRTFERAEDPRPAAVCAGGGMGRDCGEPA